MSWVGCPGVLVGLAALAAGQALAQEDLAARVKKAQDAARASATSSEGREWVQRHSPASGSAADPRPEPVPAGAGG